MASLGIQVVSGDIVWGGGAISVVTDPLAALAQLLVSRLSMVLGEWFLDPDDGLDLYNSILGKSRGEGVIRQALRTRILGTPGVKALQSLSLELDGQTRALAIRIVVQATPTAASVVTGSTTITISSSDVTRTSELGFELGGEL